MDVVAVNRDSLTVQWYFDLTFRWYPWEKMGAFVYDRKLGAAMEESLDSLQLFLKNSGYLSDPLSPQPQHSHLKKPPYASTYCYSMFVCDPFWRIGFLCTAQSPEK